MPIDFDGGSLIDDTRLDETRRRKSVRERIVSARWQPGFNA
jgi:hypothetical protein